METYPLLLLTLTHGGWTKELEMESAELALVTDAGSRLWYIDVNGVADSELLDYFYTASDIGVEVSALTKDGRRLEGTAYFHANKLHRAAALRGDGELIGV
ncbi:hypothetical protein ACTHPH_16575 [Paenibacillus pasadenensis]|uniref:Uncharacterized protein n=1 Tax=Paenibacillus pasadenensis TaxID=217090 RepID=A0A2N5N3W7_9BACL|nr:MULTISPECIES: hypothetical protein [Paenibacillus]PLT45044.1 hypothetical protein B8V81_3475 [Paenibacillus pasadenensis]QGG55461.1 hypothetical protein GE073_07720 [Paenibacillus sp. B01]